MKARLAAMVTETANASGCRPRPGATALTMGMSPAAVAWRAWPESITSPAASVGAVGYHQVGADREHRGRHQPDARLGASVDPRPAVLVVSAVSALSLLARELL